MVAALDLPEPSWRVAAPLSWREPRARHVRGPRERVYVSVRAYSDESFGLGQMLDVEVFLPDESVRFRARVQAIQTLGPRGPARYDLVLDVFDIRPSAFGALLEVLMLE